MRGQHDRFFKNDDKDIYNIRKKNLGLNCELRKNKREAEIIKHRLQNPTNDNVLNISDGNLEEIFRNCRCTNLDEKFAAIQAARKVLSSDSHAPIDAFINVGMLPIFIECLANYDSPNLQFEAAWALTNVASGNSVQTQAVIDSGAVPHLIRLLSSSNLQLCEQAIWALGNIIGDGPAARDFVTNHGILNYLPVFINNNISISFFRNISWVFVNLCRNRKPPIHIDLVKALMPSIAHLIHHSDLNVVIDMAWTLSYITDAGNNYIQLVIDYGLVTFLTPLVSHNDNKIQTAALRAIGNIATGDNQQTNVVIECGILKLVGPLLTNKKDKLTRETLWLLSNVAAGTHSQIDALINSQLLPLVMNCLIEREFIVSKEAVWVICNIAIGGTINHLTYLINLSCIPELCKFLTCKDPQIVLLILDSLSKFLKNVGDQAPNLCLIIEECDGLDKIESLQHHENENIYKAACTLIQTYFNDEIIEDTHIVPTIDNKQFQFGSNLLATPNQMSFNNNNNLNTSQQSTLPSENQSVPFSF